MSRLAASVHCPGRRIRAAGAIVAGLAWALASVAPYARDLAIEPLPGLPQALTNNAVAAVERDDGVHLLSLMGLRAGKRWHDTTSEAWHLAPGAREWRRLRDVPGERGRLAGVAAGVGELAYIFGGYTVAEDGSEVSVPSVHTLDPVTGQYRERAPMPVPVDDTVALPFEDRYIYLVSGWHDSGNVNLVQVYDTDLDTWHQATPWPGRPLFGHAGGIVGRQLVVCDGVGIETARKSRRFVAIPVCLRGEIDAANRQRIDWYAIAHHPGSALYRMAASGSVIDGEAVIVFAGGSPNPYNYDGVGYDSRLSPPSAQVFAWQLTTRRWRRLGRLPAATMDHRGLPRLPGGFAIIGGMRDQQRVTGQAFTFAPELP